MAPDSCFYYNPRQNSLKNPADNKLVNGLLGAFIESNGFLALISQTLSYALTLGSTFITTLAPIFAYIPTISCTFNPIHISIPVPSRYTSKNL